MTYLTRDKPEEDRMLEMKKKLACTEKEYLVHRHELPLSCPTDAMELWSAHPKVYLPLDVTGRETCPYCGTCFILQDD